MRPFSVPLELELRKESTKRVLEELYDDGDWEGLIAAAELLNVLWHQQAAISRWLAHEAAENLGEAWESSRKQPFSHGQAKGESDADPSGSCL
jgi:hypothetical protein